MNSNDVNDHALSDRGPGQAKKPWVKPFLEVIALQSAEGKTAGSKPEGTASHGTYNYS